MSGNGFEDPNVSSEGAAERLRALLDASSVQSIEEREAALRVLRSGPPVTADESKLPALIDRLRFALTAIDQMGEHGGGAVRLSAVDTAAERVAMGTPSGAASDDDPGLLTRLTSRISADEAMSLYARIAPRLAVGILSALGHSRDLSRVRLLSQHLCEPAVQQRLRSAKHVRNALLDEVAAFLPPHVDIASLTRDDVLTWIEQSDCMNDLRTLERCVLATRGVA